MSFCMLMIIVEVPTLIGTTVNIMHVAKSEQLALAEIAIGSKN